MEMIYIAGASSRARTTKEYLESLYPVVKVRAFLVSPEMTDNSDEEDGTPVWKIDGDFKADTSCKVYIGTRGVNHDKLTAELIGAGFLPDNIIPVTPKLDMDLRNEYVRRSFECEGKSFEKLEVNDSGQIDNCNTGNVCIYIAKTVFDKDFSEPVDLKDHEKIIQAGCDLTDKLEEAVFFDNEGDNISGRNKQFSELTAFYWIWKHASQDVIGLEHWRRRFILPDDWLNRMEAGDIDVVLPVPLCVMPSLEGNFIGRHEPKVWYTAMEILKEMHPEDHDDAQKYFREKKLYSPCNMIIAKKDILKEYCEWLFPMLLKLNDKIGNLEDSYQNRYPGFVSERFLNFFFEKNRDRYNVAYADKSFLS